MQSKATTVAAYLRELPAERRALLDAVRKVFRANLDQGIEEVMNYGMIGYVIPHSLYPAGYHCDPSKPFPYGGLASQKNYCSLYLFPVYAEAENWFRAEWKKGGKKLDMGKCCVRFKKLDDLDLDVLARALRRFTIAQTLQTYKQLLASRTRAQSKSPSGKGLTAPAQRPAPAHRPAQVAAAGQPGVKSTRTKPVTPAQPSPAQPSPAKPLGKNSPAKQAAPTKSRTNSPAVAQFKPKRKQVRRG